MQLEVGLFFGLYLACLSIMLPHATSCLVFLLLMFSWIAVPADNGDVLGYLCDPACAFAVDFIF